jgi:hypothetical protein
MCRYGREVWVEDACGSCFFEVVEHVLDGQVEGRTTQGRLRVSVGSFLIDGPLVSRHAGGMEIQEKGNSEMTSSNEVVLASSNGVSVDRFEGFPAVSTDALEGAT